ncbi:MULTISPECIES: AlpA family transcriptional regulator [unclassified Bifidobacterium]|uniref:helix-turn-helix transcriptional regulator n=1 Tax=unclassified Bifidobacterium TaxID=2608897 RepID=UPI001C612261|nr:MULTISPECIES: hypothetical protein [unclassified Bifidobacterium]TPF79440.1 hypothetical protein BW08_09915 [Bifidobacterium sp. UTCIF-24]TPF89183.1 hypothetical protein BW10_07415 [Bifidobacterium sp. UTBIF-56]TPF95297.1 hypothetical protein BG22_02900 [Bifidobacterium sp. UTBIF-78]
MCEQMTEPELFDSLQDTLKPMNTTKDVAATGISEGTLGYWRSMGIGPKFVKVGRSVLYPKETILEYFRTHVYQSTSEVRGE